MLFSDDFLLSRFALFSSGPTGTSQSALLFSAYVSVRLTVETKSTLDGIDQLTGVHKVVFSEENHHQAVLSVDREQMTQIMIFLADKQIVNLTSTPPKLEDLFMRYYEKQGVDSYGA